MTTLLNRILNFSAATVFLIALYFPFYVMETAGAFERLALFFVGLTGSCLLFYYSDTGKRFLVFSRESLSELKKVVWPTRAETSQMTLVVFVFVLIVALFLWFVDFILGYFLDFFAL